MFIKVVIYSSNFAEDFLITLTSDFKRYVNIFKFVTEVVVALMVDSNYEMTFIYSFWLSISYDYKFKI